MIFVDVMVGYSRSMMIRLARYTAGFNARKCGISATDDRWFAGVFVIVRPQPIPFRAPRHHCSVRVSRCVRRPRWRYGGQATWGRPRSGPSRPFRPRTDRCPDVFRGQSRPGRRVLRRPVRADRGRGRHRRGRGAVALRRRRLHGLRGHPARGGARRHRALPARGRPTSSPRRCTRSTTRARPRRNGWTGSPRPRPTAEPRCWSAVSTRAGPTMRSRSPRPGCVPASTPSPARRSSTTRPTTSPTRCGSPADSAPRWTRPR